MLNSQKQLIFLHLPFHWQLQLQLHNFEGMLYVLVAEVQLDQEKVSEAHFPLADQLILLQQLS